MELHEQRYTIARLERESLRDPRGYRRKVMMMAALGPTITWGLLVAALALLALLARPAFAGGGILVSAGALIPFALLAYVVYSAARVRFEPPTGVVVERRHAKRFMDSVEYLRKAAGGPRFRQVLLTTELSASVIQVPQLGLFGLPHTYLQVGLPLMLAMPYDEVMAVIARQYAYVSRTHGKSGVWVYRTRETWRQVLDALELNQKPGTALFLRFAQWYVPLFSAYAYVLLRRHELVAERLSARLAGAQPAALALVRLQVSAGWLAKRFWPTVRMGARSDATPPEHVFISLTKSVMGMPQTPDELQEYLVEPEGAMGVIQDPSPSLAERLKAVGQPMMVPPRLAVPAAQEIFGKALGRAEAAVSEAWVEENREAWQAMYEQAVEERTRLDALDGKRLAKSLSREEAWERAEILEAEGRMDDYEQELGEILAAHPDFAPALYARGRTLLSRGSDQGLELLDKAMEISEAGAMEACQSAVTFLKARGRAQDAQRYTQKVSEYATLLERAKAERQNYSVSDPIDPHGLRPRALSELKAQLVDQDDVREAYLVRKRVSHMRELPVYVLGVHVRMAWTRSRKVHARIMQNRLQRTLVLPSDWFCLVLDGQSRAIQERFKTVANGPIFTRGA